MECGRGVTLRDHPILKAQQINETEAAWVPETVEPHSSPGRPLRSHPSGQKHSFPRLLGVLAAKCSWLKGAASCYIISTLRVACSWWLVHKGVQGAAKTGSPSLHACSTLRSHSNPRAPPGLRRGLCWYLCHSVTSLLSRFPHTHRCLPQQNTCTPVSIPESISQKRQP